MGNIRVLSANDLMRITGVKGKQYKDVQWHTDHVIMKHTLDASEFISVIMDTVKDCKSPDGRLAPELMDFAVRVNVIASYAFVELPEDAGALFYIAYASDLYDTIRKNANTSQIDAIMEAVRTYILRDGGAGNE